jgi:hypothetical protein
MKLNSYDFLHARNLNDRKCLKVKIYNKKIKYGIIWHQLVAVINLPLFIIMQKKKKTKILWTIE